MDRPLPGTPPRFPPCATPASTCMTSAASSPACSAPAAHGSPDGPAARLADLDNGDIHCALRGRPRPAPGRKAREREPGATGIRTLRCQEASNRWEQIWPQPHNQTGAA